MHIMVKKNPLTSKINYHNTETLGSKVDRYFYDLRFNYRVDIILI